MAPSMTQNELKHAVAQAAIDYVLPKLHQHDILGIGTGSTANMFIDLLAQHKDAFQSCVASSTASAQRLAQHGISVSDLTEIQTLRFYIDGADEANKKLHLIKGGGAALTREKIVAACADEFICIADESKWVQTLGQFPLPVEIIPMARNHVIRELTKLGGRVELRPHVTTDNGGEILDIHGLSIDDAPTLEHRINQIVGVITNGLFAQRPADILLLGTRQGIKTINASQDRT